MAACFADRGISTIGVDVNPRTVAKINAGESPIFEPGLAELISRGRGQLRATEDVAEGVLNSEVTFIVVPTPSESHGGFSLRYVNAAAEALGKALRDKPAQHDIVLTSTVLPGSSEHSVIPLIENFSGKRCGEGFGFCYNPEFIALGTVILDFLNPDFILIGESDGAAGERLERLYHTVCENDPPASRVNIVSAELAKISVNSFVTMKISFANMLAALCEELPGADVDSVTAAIGRDSRIGSKYLKGALGYGGPCFPRDNMALAYLAKQLGVRSVLPEATDAFNSAFLERLTAWIAGSVPSQAVVAVLGLSYKPNTTVVEESQGLKLAERFAARGLRVVVYDPVALESARAALKKRVRYAETLEGAIKDAKVIVVANPDQEFRALNRNNLMTSKSRPLLIDLWRMFRDSCQDGNAVDYRAVGLGSHSAEKVTRLRKMWGGPKPKDATPARQGHAVVGRSGAIHPE
jgi:UDPglucose 6-dehydrogenase